MSHAFLAHATGSWLTVAARVSRALPDELGRLQHQRFIVRCPSGQTVLIVNDISVGRRVPLRLGAQVIVRGIYIWNKLGGLVHYTHHSDTGGQGGWVYLNGHLYSLSTARMRRV